MRPAFTTVSFAAIALGLLAVPAAAQEPLQISGALEDSDSQTGEDNARYDDHPLRLEAGRRYRISVNSEAFDPMAQLYVSGQDEPVAENDDSNESLNSRIVYAPSASGDHRLRVLGFSAEARGAYAVEVVQMPPLAEPATLFQRMEATIWRVYAGAIGATDPENDGKHFDDYRISFAAGQRRLIWLESEAFDSMVEVYRLDAREGEPLASDDDSGGGLNSFLVFTAEEAGDYVVRVTTFDETESGAYRLRVSE